MGDYVPSRGEGGATVRGMGTRGGERFVLLSLLPVQHKLYSIVKEESGSVYNDRAVNGWEESTRCYGWC